MRRSSPLRDTTERILADRGIALDHLLRTARRSSDSYEAIALDIHTKTGGLITVSYRTIARWCQDIEETAA